MISGDDLEKMGWQKEGALWKHPRVSRAVSYSYARAISMHNNYDSFDHELWQAGEKLFGFGWQKKAAKFLDVSTVTIWLWLNKKHTNKFKRKFLIETAKKKLTP